MSARDEEILKEGFIVKKGHIRHNWKSRWFVLRLRSLSYFKSKGVSVMAGSTKKRGKRKQAAHYVDKTPKGVINLKGCSLISPDPEYTKKECVFRLIEILGTEYLLQCSNEKERDDWVHEIGTVVRKLDSLVTKSNSIKVSNRPNLHSPMPSPELERKRTNSPTLMVLQNRVTHQDLMEAMQDSEAGLQLRNHHFGNNVYKLCFSGEDLVGWLLAWSFVQSRDEGRAIASELLEEVYLHPIGPVSEDSIKRKAARKAFCDSTDALYRFEKGTSQDVDFKNQSTTSINSGVDIDFEISDSSDESENEEEQEKGTSQDVDVKNQILDDFQGEIIKQGFLVKKGHVRHNWKVRKFILYDEPARLSYYCPKKDINKGRKGRVKVIGSEVQSLDPVENQEETSCTRGCNSVTREHCFLIRTRKGMKYILQAPTKEEKEDWVKNLDTIIQKYPT